MCNHPKIYGREETKKVGDRKETFCVAVCSGCGKRGPVCKSEEEARIEFRRCQAQAVVKKSWERSVESSEALRVADKLARSGE